MLTNIVKCAYGSYASMLKLILADTAQIMLLIDWSNTYSIHIVFTFKSGCNSTTDFNRSFKLLWLNLNCWIYRKTCSVSFSLRHHDCSSNDTRAHSNTEQCCVVLRCTIAICLVRSRKQLLKWQKSCVYFLVWNKSNFKIQQFCEIFTFVWCTEHIYQNCTFFTN